MDLAALVCDLRPCLMIDYATLDAQTVAELAGSVSTQTGIPLAALLLGDCWMLVRGGSTAVEPAVDEPRIFVGLTASGLEILLPSETPRAVQLAATASCLNAMAEKGLVAGPQQHPEVLDLDSLRSRGAELPTLAGLLLGYPVVYVVGSREEGDRLAQHLSGTSLVYHSVSCELAGAAGVPAVQAYTVPTSLVKNETIKGAGVRWREHILHALEQARRRGWPWQTAIVEHTAMTPRPVAL